MKLKRILCATALLLSSQAHALPTYQFVTDSVIRYENCGALPCPVRPPLDPADVNYVTHLLNQLSVTMSDTIGSLVFRTGQVDPPLGDGIMEARFWSGSAVVAQTIVDGSWFDVRGDLELAQSDGTLSGTFFFNQIGLNFFRMASVGGGSWDGNMTCDPYYCGVDFGIAAATTGHFSRVPEPGTLALGALGLVVLMRLRR